MNAPLSDAEMKKPVRPLCLRDSRLESSTRPKRLPASAAAKPDTKEPRERPRTENQRDEYVKILQVKMVRGSVALFEVVLK